MSKPNVTIQYEIQPGAVFVWEASTPRGYSVLPFIEDLLDDLNVLSTHRSLVANRQDDIEGFIAHLDAKADSEAAK